MDWEAVAKTASVVFFVLVLMVTFVIFPEPVGLVCSFIIIVGVPIVVIGTIISAIGYLYEYFKYH